jgi:hypothetical protein
MHGIGIYSNEFGESRMGKWENDRRIEWVGDEFTNMTSMIINKKNLEPSNQY